jgi:hypothetical protein
MAVHDLTAVPLVVSSSQKKPRRRKTTLARALREAAKAGVNVAGATIEDGKVTLTFGEPRPTETGNPWLADLNKVTKQ